MKLRKLDLSINPLKEIDVTSLTKCHRLEEFYVDEPVRVIGDTSLSRVPAFKDFPWIHTIQEQVKQKTSVQVAQPFFVN